ncbi:hypothetical protein [Amycolatopsis sp. CA-230715]|uniref:hypothetical protein n=1 Tax=Amycolatopsis sp. CA-230715 TaxID=2745196 RepID=UPI001C023A82|nr:hypothetical protein [Amycolatopsis sp. CA-230715]QWF79555.1 hypothetical protein HUW46_02963 [Amycolatopsis sp. CA-230715]
MQIIVVTGASACDRAVEGDSELVKRMEIIRIIEPSALDDQVTQLASLVKCLVRGGDYGVRGHQRELLASREHPASRNADRAADDLVSFGA